MNWLSKLFWGALLISPLPYGFYYAIQLANSREYWFLAILVPIAIGLFLFRWDKTVRNPGLWQLSICAVSLVSTVIGYWRASPWLVVAGLVLGIFGFLASQSSRVKGDRSMLFAWPCFLLMLRLPRGQDGIFSAWTDRVTTQITSRLLDSQSITHRINDQTLETLKHSWSLGGEWTETMSVFAALGAGVLLAAWRNRSLVLAPLFAAFSVVWFILIQVIQWTWIGAMSEWYTEDWGDGWRRIALTSFSILIFVLLLLSTDRLLRILFFPTSSDYLRSGKVNPLTRLWNQLFVGLATSSLQDTKVAAKPEQATKGQAAGMFALIVVSVLIFALQIALPNREGSKPSLETTDSGAPS